MPAATASALRTASCTEALKLAGTIGMLNVRLTVYGEEIGAGAVVVGEEAEHVSPNDANWALIPASHGVPLGAHVPPKKDAPAIPHVKSWHAWSAGQGPFEFCAAASASGPVGGGGHVASPGAKGAL